MNIYVSNLSPETTQNDLRKAFETHGEVSGVTIQTEERSLGRNTGPSKGYGFVIMPDNTNARLAVAALDCQLVHGIPLKVQLARASRNSRHR